MEARPRGDSGKLGAVSVNDRIVASPSGEEFVVEAWRPLEAYGATPLLGMVLAVISPGWRVGVKRFPVAFGSRAVHIERVLGEKAAQRRVDSLARGIEQGRVPGR